MREATARPEEYTPTSVAAADRVLSTHTDRSGTTIHGPTSIAFGSVFAAVGIAVAVLAWQGHLHASRGVPPWLGAFIGGLFAVVGTSFIAHGLAGLASRRRVRRLRSTHERQPWVWDHPWDESGSRDDSGRRIARAIWLAGLLMLFVVPFNWIGFFSPDRPPVFAIIAALLDAMVLGCGWHAVYLVSQRAKYGVSMLRFRRFPFRPGGEVELHLARPLRLSGIEAPEARLRCVQERYEMHGSGGDRTRVIVAVEVWSVVRTAEYRRGEYVWCFEVPAGLPGTALSELPPRYWELELKIEASGVDYAGTFLVPIYADERRRERLNGG